MEGLVRNNIVNIDIKSVVESDFIEWSNYRNKTFYITGVTGTIGSFIMRCILVANERYKLNIKIIAAVRDIKKARTFFARELIVYGNVLKFHNSNILKPIKYNKKIDYIIHAANNTSSKSFVEKPVETFNTAVKGTENILKFAKDKDIESMVFLSSMEVFGNIENQKKLSENELGTIDLTNVRNSYPAGKRGAETLCHAYAKEYNLPIKVARLAQVIGANVEYNDSRVYAQFARSVIEKKDIILHTTGDVIRSYCYITDITTAILKILIDGQNGDVYNISNENATIKIKDIAKMLVDKYSDINLVFDINNTNIYPSSGSDWELNTTKLKNLKWCAKVDLEEMFSNLISSFQHQTQLKLDKKPFLSPYQRIFSIKNFDEKKIITLLNNHYAIERQGIYSFFINKARKNGIQKNKIVFANYQGLGYGCNPKYIVEELLKRRNDLDLVWLVKSDVTEDYLPKQVKRVRYNSIRAYKELANAKIWVNNYHQINFLKRGLDKLPEQKYIQLWHGSLGIKKIEKSVPNLTQDKKWLALAKLNSQITDYWISNSKFETEVFQNSFWDVKGIKELGHARNDIFFKDSSLIKEKIYNYFKIDKNKKIILYVPSFRSNYNFQCYRINVEKLKQALYKKFGVDFVFMARLHPRVARFSQKIYGNTKDIIDATRYSDIQELLVASDIAITDYSSCIFDFMLSKKPAFIFATDMNEYNTERGFYYPLEETPFPIANNNDELIQNIENFDYQKYKQDVEQFLLSKGCIEDGHASERIADLIEEIINHAEN